MVSSIARIPPPLQGEFDLRRRHLRFPRDVLNLDIRNYRERSFHEAGLLIRFVFLNFVQVQGLFRIKVTLLDFPYILVMYDSQVTDVNLRQPSLTFCMNKTAYNSISGV